MYALVFGATGQIGAACAATLKGRGYRVLGTARQPSPDEPTQVAFDPYDQARADMSSWPPEAFDAVVWAQGANLNDSVYDFDMEAHLELYRTNSLYVAVTMKALLAAGRIADNARLCVISSIWQRLARRNKFSYMMTKAALQGLVMSAALDLAERGMLVNAILPGALDTPMTRANLSSDQIVQVARSTPHHRLPTLNDVAELAAFLCSPLNTSITGEFIAVDLGFQNARLV